MAKVDPNYVFKTIKGDEVKDGDMPLTLRLVTQAALLHHHLDDGGVAPTEKVHRWRLAQKFESPSAIQISSEDAVLIKRYANKLYGPLIVGQLETLLK